MATDQTDDLKPTPLHDLHLELDARMVPFAGYSMPVQYEGVKTEHLHTREAAGLFDVSHMGQVLVQGEQAALQLESLIPADLVDLPVNRLVYGLLTNDRGGIMDDLIICRQAQDAFLLVVNAACKQADLAWLQDNLPALDIRLQQDRALVALQGPAAKEVLTQVIAEAGELTFMSGCHARVDGSEVYISRSGYTGEDGYEIALPADRADAFCRGLLDFDAVKPVGLGARDSLRLEAGLCLYGHDMNDTTTPVSAGLQWSIARARRPGGAREGGFPGAATILGEMLTGSIDKRVGLRVDGKAPVREGAELVDENDYLIGRVTSGSFGPSVQAPIAMGYVQTSFSAPGTQVHAMVRGRPLPVTVAKLPFVPHRYKR